MLSLANSSRRRRRRGRGRITPRCRRLWLAASTAAVFLFGSFRTATTVVGLASPTPATTTTATAAAAGATTTSNRTPPDSDSSSTATADTHFPFAAASSSSPSCSPNSWDWLRDDRSIRALCASVRPKSRLQARHEALFETTKNDDDERNCHDGGDDDDDNNKDVRALHRLGRLCCRAGVVSRKEFLETYAAARAIYQAYYDDAATTEDSAAASAADGVVDRVPPRVRRCRVADLASGHGLLGWFLLVLDRYGRRRSNGGGSGFRLSVVCVDARMPPSAQRIAQVMRDELPRDVTDRWTYVQGDLNHCRVVPAVVDSVHVDSLLPPLQPPLLPPPLLLASVHACGGLTDDVFRMALKAQVPCAVAPCCHSVKPGRFRLLQPSSSPSLSLDEILRTVQARKDAVASSHRTADDSGGDDDDDNNRRDGDKHAAVANVLDEIRQRALERAGFRVRVVHLPAAYTGRNRLFLTTTTPPASTTTPAETVDHLHHQQQQRQQSSEKSSPRMEIPFYQRQRPPTAATYTGQYPEQEHPEQQQQEQPTLYTLRIPLGNDPASIAYCQAISGKEQGRERLLRQIPKHYSLTLGLSLWLQEKHGEEGWDGDDREEKVSVDAAASAAPTTAAAATVTLDIHNLQEMIDKACANAAAVAVPATANTNNNDKKKNKNGNNGTSYQLQCHVTPSGVPNYSSNENRSSQLYQFRYTRTDGNNMSGPPRVLAKTIHRNLREQIRRDYGSDVLR